MAQPKNNGDTFIKMLFIVWIVSGIALLFGGMFSRINALVIAGIVTLFGGGFVVAIIMLVFIFIKAKRHNDSIDPDKRKDFEEGSKKAINATDHNANSMAVRQIANWLQALKLASKGDIIKSILFVSVFVGCLVGFVVLAAMGYGAWCILPWGIGCGMIVIALIVTKILEHRSVSSKRVNKNMPSQKATVVGCYTSSESYVSTGSNRHTQTSRIVNTTYRVLVDIGGERKTAFSKKFYNEGEEIYVRPVGKNYVHIDDEE